MYLILYTYLDTESEDCWCFAHTSLEVSRIVKILRDKGYSVSVFKADTSF